VTRWPDVSPDNRRTGADLVESIDRIRWRLWQGQVAQGLDLMGLDLRKLFGTNLGWLRHERGLLQDKLAAAAKPKVPPDQHAEPASKGGTSPAHDELVRTGRFAEGVRTFRPITENRGGRDGCRCSDGRPNNVASRCRRQSFNRQRPLMTNGWAGELGDLGPVRRSPLAGRGSEDALFRPMSG